MSSLTYINEEGSGTAHRNSVNNYSQLVHLPGTPLVKLSGQGGWDVDGNVLDDWKAQIEQAFDNVDKVLKAGGLRGWEDVYLMRTYNTNMEEHFAFTTETFKKKVTSHKPVWTALGVKALGLKEMIVEIEVEAYKRE